MSQNIEEENYKEKYEESLSIEVTNWCNSACSHCFVRAAISECSDLSIDLVREIISEGYRLGYRRLHITGGEPLLWEGLLEALDYAFSSGYKKVFINTNGTLLTEGLISRLSDYDGFSISVSIEGPESFHDKVRGQGSYRQTEQGIRKALDAGIDLIIFTTVSKSLLPALPHFIDDLYERFPDINLFSLIQLIRVRDDIFDLSNELLDPAGFLKLVRMVSLLNLYGHETEILNNPLAVVVSKLFEMPLIPRVLPLYRNGHLIVMADRNIALSHSIPNSFGRYEPGMIEKVLSSNEYRIAVAPDETTCPSCGYTKLCKENGMIRPSEWYRDMNPEVPFCKRVLDKASS